MHEEYKKRLSRWGVVPSMWIFPPKMSIYATMVPPEKTEYPLVGPSGVATFKEGPKALGSFRGTNVYETRLFDVYENELPIDLLRRRQQIGEYYVMVDPFRHGGAPEDSAKAHVRDIIIYDESVDNWRRVSYADALTNSPFVVEGGIKLTGADGSDKGVAQTYQEFFDHCDPTGTAAIRSPAAQPGSATTPLSGPPGTRELHAFNVPEFIASRLSTGTDAAWKTVAASNAKTAFIDLGGELGVYRSAIKGNKLVKPSAGDTEALFVPGVATRDAWNKLDVGAVVADMSSTLSFDSRVRAVCEAIVQEHEAPDVSVGTKRRAVSSRADYGSKRVRTSQEILDGLMEDRLQQRGISHAEDNEQLAYAQHFLQIGKEVPDGMKGTCTKANIIADAKDNKCPLDVLLLRPFMEYEMSSAILCKGGYDTGATFVGHSDFILGDDVVSKLHYARYFLQSTQIVLLRYGLDSHSAYSFALFSG